MLSIQFAQWSGWGLSSEGGNPIKWVGTLECHWETIGQAGLFCNFKKPLINEKLWATLTKTLA